MPILLADRAVPTTRSVQTRGHHHHRSRPCGRRGALRRHGAYGRHRNEYPPHRSAILPPSLRNDWRISAGATLPQRNTHKPRRHRMIRTDVPIHIHPDSLANLGEALNQENTPGAQVWSVGREALELCYQGYALLNDTEKALMEANPQTRLVNGRPAKVAENTKEFAAATDAAWRRMTPLIDSKVKQLR